MTPRRALPACAALLAAALVLSGCDDPDQAPPADPGANRERTIAAGDRYVALGDSYTSAFRTGKTDRDSGGCLRSKRNYPRLLAEELDLDLVDASCGGATSRDVLSPQKLENGVSVPAQITAVDAETDLVTLSVGANDIDLYDAIIGTCVDVAAGDPDGSPCADLAGQDTGKGERALKTLGETLSSIIRTIAAKAPQARVVVVGYPQTFPPEEPCEAVPIARGDVEFAYDAARQVTELLRSTAAAMEVEYADVWAATDGHDICAEDPWIAGAKPSRRDGFSYHPYPEEQRAVADLLADLLRGEDAEPG